GLRFTFVVAAYLVSTPHSSGFARLVRLRRRAFYETIVLMTFYEIIKNARVAESPLTLFGKKVKRNYLDSYLDL
ncbi:MAG: hypothetical protein QME78_06550, partial [Thermodesulfobacteriota bacterium]|nr:hypothetical protein [Thermodesulfobacteriota bacterium]